MDRHVSVPLYVGAFFLSLAIFLIGIYIGSLIDQSNLDQISGDILVATEKVKSINLLLLAEGNSTSFCPVYLSEISSVESDVEKMGHKLTYLEEEKDIYDTELKKEYFILEAESYLLSKKAKTLCDDKSVLLLYFYSNTNCSICYDQGIDVLKARDNILTGEKFIKIYSFDGTIGSPVAEALMAEFNVTGYPTIIIDNVKYEGRLNTAEIYEIFQNHSNSQAN